MRDKTVVITGATSGIGEVTAIRLAEKGARIVAVARDAARAEATLAKLRQVNPTQDHTAHLGDLSHLADVARVSREILESVPVIDVLLNNAGAIFGRRELTPEGLEKTFALNHMSYFMLTNALLRHLKAGARIINTSSDAHYRGTMDFDDLQFRQGYSGWAAYCRSKLENVLFTRALARRLAGTGITTNALHPGFVATRFGDNAGGLPQLGLSVAKWTAIKPEEGAKTMIYLASSPEVTDVSGKYFVRCEITRPSDAALDVESAERLMDISAKIAGV